MSSLRTDSLRTDTLSTDTVPAATSVTVTIPGTGPLGWLPWQRPAPTAAILGGLATLVGWLGSWNPSYWGDEAATVVSAERPLPRLFAELGRIDAVHGLYYLVMHFWIAAFGASELSTRAPSALAVGALVAGTVVLGDRLAGPRFGLLAGVICAVLPRTTYMATEARSYALGTALAVWLMAAFVVLWQRREQRTRPWLVYGVLAGLASYLFLYLILLVLVHGAVLASSAGGRRLLRTWTWSAITATVVASPIAVLAISQRHQVAFLAVRGYANPVNVLVEQWFGNPPTHGSWLMPILGWGFIVAAVMAVARRRGSQALVRVGVAWLVIPTAVLLVGNAWLSPMYNVRYLSFSTPAAALLMAAGIITVADAIRRGTLTAPVISVLLALLVITALPGYLAQRGPYAKDGGSDLRQAADYLGAHAERGDAVVFDPTPKPSQRPELAYRLYPQRFASLDAVEIVTPFSRGAHLWDVVAPLDQVRPELARVRTVWALELPVAGIEPQDIADLAAHGYRIVGSHRIHRTVVYQLNKGAA